MAAAPPAVWTHDALVERAARWLRSKGCTLVLKELTTAGVGEIPDAIGWTREETVLVECKVSRADFLAERSKPHRVLPENGMGRLRYFLCPPDVIRPEDLPPKWGLLYALNRNIKLVAGPHPDAWLAVAGLDWAFEPRNWRAEQGLLRSMLSRLKLSLGPAEFDRLVHLPYHARKEEVEEMRVEGVVVNPTTDADLEAALI